MMKDSYDNSKGKLEQSKQSKQNNVKAFSKKELSKEEREAIVQCTALLENLLKNKNQLRALVVVVTDNTSDLGLHTTTMPPHYTHWCLTIGQKILFKMIGLEPPNQPPPPSKPAKPTIPPLIVA